MNTNHERLAPQAERQAEARSTQWSDLEKAALHDATLHAAVHQFRFQGVSREQAAISAALAMGRF
jgi:hypothetical protein